MICLTFPDYKQLLLISAVLFCLFQSTSGQSSDSKTSVRLAWTANTEANLEGYEVVHGTISRVYTSRKKVGLTPAMEIPNLIPGQTYFFAVRAINSSKVSSGLSSEISHRVPLPAFGEIAVENAAGAGLTSAVGMLDFDTGASVTQRLTVKNLGAAALSRLAITLEGVDAASFTVATSFPVRLSSLQNGGFELGQNAWKMSGNANALPRDNSAEGRNQLEFNGGDLTPNGSATQRFPTTPGVSYTLTYDVGVLSFNIGSQKVQTKLTGNGELASEIVQILGPDSGLTAWQTRSLTFTANSSTSDISFTDLSLVSNRIDLLIDNVRVVASRLQNLIQRTPVVTSLAVNSAATFNVTYKPLSAGSKSAVLRIASDDLDENPFVIHLNAPVGLTQPEIGLVSPENVALVSGAGMETFKAGAAASRIYTIRNTGTAPLSGLALSLSGVDSSQFSTQDLSAAPLAAGASTTFRVNFSPTSAGVKVAVLKLASNDGDENPFVINLIGGELVGPQEIAVYWKNGTELVSNTGMTFNQGTNIGTISPLVSYRIKNIGQSMLTGLALSCSDKQFVLPNLAASILAPGATLSFSVGFQPASGGVKLGKILLSSNDFDENPFVINVRGFGIVLAPEISIKSGSGQELVSDSHTAVFGAVSLGSSSAPQSFTIQNTGSTHLSGLALTSSIEQFVLTQPTTVSLAPGASTTFGIAFRPNSTGVTAATLLLASNDADENPFTIRLTGIGLASNPEIAVRLADQTDLVSDSSVSNFGATQVGEATAARFFTILNQGTAPLMGLAVTGSSADFEITSPLVGSLMPGAFTTFTARFKPASGGSKAAILNISSNDANENPFIIRVLGTGIAGLPQIAVKLGNGQTLTDGSKLVFGNVGMRQSVGRVVTVTNVGNAPLSGLSTFYTGQKQFFNVSGFPVASIRPGESTTFTVFANPSSIGEKSAIAFIYSNDPSRGTLRIELEVTGTIGPEIAITAPNDNDLSNGQSTIGFGNLPLGQSGSAMEFTIRNVGFLTLNKLSCSIVGAHTGDFSVSPLKRSALDKGNSLNFGVVFKPSAAGIRSAVLSISSNDRDENPFIIVLSGNGNAGLKNQPILLVKAVPKTSSPEVIAEPMPAQATQMSGQTTIGGEQYRTATLNWSAGAPRAYTEVVEVSSNLVDWFSGSNFTEILIDTGAILQVRDRTPFKNGQNRYIRLKPTPRAANSSP